MASWFDIFRGMMGWWSKGTSPTTIDEIGLEWTLPTNVMHYTAPSNIMHHSLPHNLTGYELQVNLMHWTEPDNLMHWTEKKEDNE